MVLKGSHDFASFLTPSSAAVFKLWFYGTLLRSKTIKLRLKNCPAHEVRGAATTCYVIFLLAKKLERKWKIPLALKPKLSEAKKYKLDFTNFTQSQTKNTPDCSGAHYIKCEPRFHLRYFYFMHLRNFFEVDFSF
jgi:hypothetical protein